jgi:acyl-CoA synthetase (AMP-forming)/AMP-acid ligase II
MLVCNNVLCGYGSTEGGTVAYAPVDCVYGIDRAVGIIAPWIDAETLNPQDAPQELGEEGQIRFRALGQGYRMQPDEAGTYEMDRSDWFYPGDMGVVYRNGLMLITGRINEIINRGGVKISPDAIEEHLKKNPAVNDAAAVGVLDSVGLEQIWMAVVAEGNADVNIASLFEYFRNTIPELTPDRIFPVREIPRNRLGKVPREALKEQLQELEAAHAASIR